jgi:AraC family transcriptional regulator
MLYLIVGGIMLNMEWQEINKKLISCEEYFHTPSLLAKSNFFYVQRIGHFNCNKDFSVRRSGLTGYLIMYTLDGQGLLKYRGEQYEIVKNHVVLINCRDYQEYATYASRNWDNKWVLFDGGMSDNFFKIIYENYGPVINISDNTSIEKGLDELMYLKSNINNNFDIKASILLHNILTEILLSATSMSENLINEYQSLLTPIIKFIEQNYGSHISVGDLAHNCNMSVFHFSREFKKVTGYSPYEYIMKFRINKGKSFLSNTKHSVEQIAVDLGFSDAGGFIRAFKKFEDITPIKFRKIHQI